MAKMSVPIRLVFLVFLFFPFFFACSANKPPVIDEIDLDSVKANEDNIIATLTANPQTGTRPLNVHFYAELLGISENEGGFYCLPYTFIFGQDLTETSIPNCPEFSGKIQTRFEATYTYTKPGVYEAAFEIGPGRSNKVYIYVYS
ncbi:MAG: hypothetical protein QXK37_03375 [Candidatus Woesearchaeota archaeon]